MVLLHSKLFREILKTVESKCQSVILYFNATKSLGQRNNRHVSCVRAYKFEQLNTFFEQVFLDFTLCCYIR